MCEEHVGEALTKETADLFSAVMPFIFENKLGGAIFRDSRYRQGTFFRPNIYQRALFAARLVLTKISGVLEIWSLSSQDRELACSQLCDIDLPYLSQRKPKTQSWNKFTTIKKSWTGSVKRRIGRYWSHSCSYDLCFPQETEEMDEIFSLNHESLLTSNCKCSGGSL